MKGQDLMINSTKEMLKVILQNVLDFSSVQVAELVYLLRLKILKTVFEKKYPAFKHPRVQMANIKSQISEMLKQNKN
jgi:hypothetical protein